MNDFDPSLDEIVSAYVDGEATPDERARVEADPVLVERAATFRALHEAVSAPDSPASDDVRRALIRRAVAGTAPTVATVHTLRRSRRATTLGPIVAAAAVIAMFFGLGTLLVASQDNGDDSSASGSFASADAESLNAQSGLRAPQEAARTTVATGGAGATAGTAKANPSYLGGFADEASLRQAVIAARDGIAGTSAATTQAGRATTASSDTARCAHTDPADGKVYVADLRGRPVTVVVSGTRADVFDDTTCQFTMLELPSR